MEEPPGNREDQEPSIELEPLVTRADAGRYVESEKSESAGAGGDHGLPIPEHPPHNCPNCNYSLTGLTSRRCPECGEPFTLAQARRAGHWLTPAGAADLRVLRGSVMQRNVGIGLLAASVIVPLAALFRANTLLHFLVVGICVACLFAGVVIRVYLHGTWPAALLLAGVTAAALNTLVTLIAL